MSERLTATLWNPQQAHGVIQQAWTHAKNLLQAGQRLSLEIKPETRSTDQNRLLWAALSDVSEQVVWYGEKLSPEDFKHIFTAALKKQRSVPGLDGGFVVLGQSTSKMTKSEFSELIELIHAFGAERAVVWSDQRREGE